MVHKNLGRSEYEDDDTGSSLGGPPVAVARTSSKPCTKSNKEIQEILSPFLNASVANSYRGPSWIDDDGEAWLIIVSKQAAWPRVARQEQQLALITWRWNLAPSAPISLTAVVPGHSISSAPTPRWMGSSEDPVVLSIKSRGTFMVMLAQPDGSNSGWMQAKYSQDSEQSEKAGFAALQRQFDVMGTPGIQGSSIGVRYQHSDEDSEDDKRNSEIPMWADDHGDYWVTINYKGPWSKDIETIDKFHGAWGSKFYRARNAAAGSIELLRDRFHVDGEQPFFDASGMPTSRLSGDVAKALVAASERSLNWAQFAAAVAGPNPDAKSAYEAACRCMSCPISCDTLMGSGLMMMAQVDDEHLMPSIKMFVECVLLSPGATNRGLAKPWLMNDRQGLVLKSTPIDTSLQLDDIKTYWRHGLDLHDILDSGLWSTGSDVPYPLINLGKAMSGTRIEGGAESASTRIAGLLKEAIEAKQWSIPWGARVQISIGPFVALRVFENKGEFACVFLDQDGRYYHVAIGLRQSNPQFCSADFLLDEKFSGDVPSEEIWQWDHESKLTLQLIAAAIVRDFLVVERRESVFLSRPFKRRVRGHDIRTIIYLPRVNYSRQVALADQDDQQTASEPELKRTRHIVSPHLRRAETSSAEQRFLAQRYGVHVPQGFTFVRPHERGANEASQRIIVYRSRSASMMIFDALEKAPEGNRPQWFDFEKDCAALLRSRGLKVQHSAVNRDGDGGVDLYATDESGCGLVVQCKCWGLHRPVGPEVIRELNGAIALADVGASTPSKGMVITTSQFTTGAKDSAKQLGFELVEGSDFSKIMRQLLASEVARPLG